MRRADQTGLPGHNHPQAPAESARARSDRRRVPRADAGGGGSRVMDINRQQPPYSSDESIRTLRRVSDLASLAERGLNGLARRAEQLLPMPNSVVRTLRRGAQSASTVANVTSPRAGSHQVAAGAAAPQPVSVVAQRRLPSDPLKQLAWLHVYREAYKCAEDAYQRAYEANQNRGEAVAAFYAEWREQVRPEIWANKLAQNLEELRKEVTEMAVGDAQNTLNARLLQTTGAAYQAGLNPHLPMRDELSRQEPSGVWDQAFKDSYEQALHAITQAVGADALAGVPESLSPPPPG
jgi:hypothetical protein